MLPSIDQLREELPPFQGKKTVLNAEQDNNDIIKEILRKHRKYETDYDKIYDYFYAGDIEITCRRIWEFLKYNLVYNAEPEETQSIKGPSGILQPGEAIDCKHYSLFAGGVLDAIKAHEGGSWDWCYRFVSYNSKPIATHVFVVVTKNNGTEIWVDPVMSAFNQRDPYTFYIDLKPGMALYEINGVPKGSGKVGAGPPSHNPAIMPATYPTVTVDPQVSEASFLTAVNMNLFGIKDLLRRNPNVVNTTLRNYYRQNGYDFEHLIRFINS